jgi:hypothetical protein
VQSLWRNLQQVSARPLHTEVRSLRPLSLLELLLGIEYTAFKRELSCDLDYLLPGQGNDMLWYLLMGAHKCNRCHQRKIRNLQAFV